jgi:putative ABC transport system substrate-binding protein
MLILVFLFLFATTSFMSAALPGAAAHAQERQTGKVYRIGFLRAGQPPETYVDGFQQGLRDRGYVVGQNVIVEFRATDGSFDQLSPFAEELVRCSGVQLRTWTRS